MKNRAINTRYVQNLHIPQWQLSGNSEQFKKGELDSLSTVAKNATVSILEIVHYRQRQNDRADFITFEREIINKTQTGRPVP